MAGKLIKIDRNGSKHFEGLVECPKCSGRGLIIHHMENGQPSYNWTDGGVCWKCSGTGKVIGKWIERTPEYQEKLDAKRKARQEAKAAEIEAKRAAEYEVRYQESLERNGFNANGKTFIFLGDTYSKKDEIKAAGGKFDIATGWHIANKIEGFDFIEATVDEIARVTDWGMIEITAIRSEWDAKKEQALNRLNGAGEFIGEIGQKVEMTVKYIKTASWDVQFTKGYWGTTTQYLHTFKDEAGNTLIWKTSNVLGKNVDDNWQPIEIGEQIKLKGTIKEHAEYKGLKQTALTRCRIAWEISRRAAAKPPEELKGE